MEYLSQEEVTMIFNRWINRLVLKVKKPTKFICTLCNVAGFGRYLHVCKSMSRPENSIIICEFDVENTEDRPDIDEIRRFVEKEWDFLSNIKKSYYEKELQ